MNRQSDRWINRWSGGWVNELTMGSDRIGWRLGHNHFFSFLKKKLPCRLFLLLLCVVDLVAVAVDVVFGFVVG
jgi:hypothetical protein